jgi:hypothetical protein
MAGLQQLPSLGATTSVPGAAGLSTSVGGGYYGADGTLNIFVGGGETPRRKEFTETFSTQYEKLFGADPAEMFQTQKDASVNPNDTTANGGEEIIDGPVPISGSLDDLIKWLQDNAPLLIMVGLVLLLAFYGLSAATRR